MDLSSGKMLLKIQNRLRQFIERLSSIPLRFAMKQIGRGVILKRGIQISHPECVALGDNVVINEFCWISVLPWNRQKSSADIPLSPKFTIGDDSYIGRFTTFSCMNEITIGKAVMISDRVYIGDGNHGYADRDLPIKDQYMNSTGPVSIGDGSWLGINVSVLPNVRIGKGCVIGAHSVVTENIPDYHIAVGIPARVIKARDA